MLNAQKNAQLKIHTKNPGVNFARVTLFLRPCVSEAFCPNIQPRAHARLTGLTTCVSTWLGELMARLSSDRINLRDLICCVACRLTVSMPIGLASYAPVSCAFTCFTDSLNEDVLTYARGCFAGTFGGRAKGSGLPVVG